MRVRVYVHVRVRVHARVRVYVEVVYLNSCTCPLPFQGSSRMHSSYNTIAYEYTSAFVLEEEENIKYQFT